MRTLRLLAALCAVSVGCGDDDDGGGGGDVDAATVIDAAVGGPDASPYCAPSTSATDAGSYILFLNFEGATITPGLDDAPNNVSSILQADATIPPAFESNGQRDVIISRTIENVEELLGPYDIGIVTTRPDSGDYGMVMFGGRGEDIGIANVGSIFPASCAGPTNKVAFVFEATTDPEGLASAVVAAVGTFAGLGSTNTAGDCMCLVGDQCQIQMDNCVITEGVLPLVDGFFCPSTGMDEMNPALMFSGLYGCRP